MAQQKIKLNQLDPEVQAAIDEAAESGGGGGAWGDITGTLSAQTDLQTALDAKADETDLTALSTATTTALAGKAATSHSHGLADLTATGTKDNSTFLRGDNTWAVPAGDGTGDVTSTVIAAATAKTTPVDADTMPLTDSAASSAMKKVTWANIKATLKTYYDTLYATAASVATAITTERTTAATLTNKTIDTEGPNTVKVRGMTLSSSAASTGTINFPSSSGSQTVTTLAGTQTLTNKTLTSPVVNTPTGIVKGDVGLGNVDNTADTAKPVSTAQQTALDGKLSLTGGSVDGDTTVAGNFAVKDELSGATKAYRFRTSGSDLDFDAAGKNMTFSSYVNADFTGAQRTYMIFGAEYEYMKFTNLTIFIKNDGSDGMTWKKADSLLDMNGTKITDLGAPTDAGDAVPKDSAFTLIGRGYRNTNGTTLTATFTAHDYLRFVFSASPSATTGTHSAVMTFNGDTGTNYSSRASTDGGAVGTAVSQTGIALQSTSATSDMYFTGDISRKSGTSIMTANGVLTGGAAATTAPGSRHIYGKHVGSAITSITIAASVGEFQGIKTHLMVYGANGA